MVLASACQLISITAPTFFVPITSITFAEAKRSAEVAYMQLRILPQSGSYAMKTIALHVTLSRVACRRILSSAAILLLAQLPPFIHAVAVRADTLWYSGDFDGQSGYINRITTAASSVPAAKMFENFVVADPLGWKVSAVWSNNFNIHQSIEQVDWSIRADMAQGSGGNVLFSGTSAATVTPTGRAYQPDDETNLPEYSIIVSGLNVFLPPGEYWLNVTPYADGDVLISSSVGKNSFGAPAANDNNGLWWWSVPDHVYDDTGFGFSMGVAGHSVPEPTTGDTNGDGDVNLDDLNAVRNNFGASGPVGSTPGDAFPFDGVVDLDDLNGVRNNFGFVSPSPVPEPGTLTLLALGAAVCCGVRRLHKSS